MKPSTNNPWTRERVLAAFKQAAQANNGEPLSQTRFEEIVPTSAWRRKLFARFSDIVREAGYEPRKPNARHSDADLLAPVALLVRRLKRFPSEDENIMERLNDPTFPSQTTLRRHFDGRRGLIAALLSFCTENSEFHDVFHILRPIQEPESAVDPERARDGFVYLMKRGKYYKIGFTNNVQGRQSQLNRPAPESVPHTAVHSFLTDDPRGIEAYWHRRFAHKRREGEYFELSPKDVAAFKRRKKFM